MYLYELIVGNRELVKILYASIIVLICTVITLKSDRVFRLSNYKGIRYFRNAFFFYGLSFIVRYFFNFDNYYQLKTLIFEFFLIMAGFFLLYSLLWKKIESVKESYSSSLFNKRILIFYLITAVIVSLDYLWQTFYFLFLSQIIIFLFAFSISLNNYKARGESRKFLKFYSIAMLLVLITWVLNAFLALWLNWDPSILMIIYLLNIIVFIIFLYGLIKVTKR